MRPWIRWLYAVAGVAAAFVAASSIVQAVRQGSWTPVVAVAWLSAVVVAVWPGTYRRCLRTQRR
jgi:roadblock/LC7 domain-containing protein